MPKHQHKKTINNDQNLSPLESSNTTTISPEKCNTVETQELQNNFVF